MRNFVTVRNNVNLVFLLSLWACFLGLLFPQLSFSRELIDPLKKPTSPSDWRMADRAAYLKARQSTLLIPDLLGSKPGSEFFIAWSNNLKSDRPSEYETIGQRHTFYDVFSSLLFASTETAFPSKLRCIKFFDIAARVTDEYHVGAQEFSSFEKFLGELTTLLPKITLDQKRFLAETNKELFNANFSVIRSLMLDWKRPQDPNKSSTAEISALDFDIRMVSFEQLIVQRTIEQYKSKFGTAALGELSELFKGQNTAVLIALSAFRGLSATGALATNTIIKEWFPQIGITNFNFELMEHRVLLGLASVFREHKLNPSDLSKYLKQKTLPSISCKFLGSSNGADEQLPRHKLARATAAVGALASDNTGLSVAVVKGTIDALNILPASSAKRAEVVASAKRLIASIAENENATALIRTLDSRDALVVGVGLFAGQSRILPTHFSGRLQVSAAESQEHLSQLLVSLASQNNDSLIWEVVRSATGVAATTPLSYLTENTFGTTGKTLAETIKVIASAADPSSELKSIIQLVSKSAIESSVASLKLAPILLAQPKAAWIFLDKSSSGDTRGAVKALGALANSLGNPDLLKIAEAANTAVGIVTAVQDIAQRGFLTGSLGALGMFASGGASIIPGLIAGASPGEQDASRVALAELKSILVEQFSIVNSKLDRILDILADNKRTLDELSSQLTSIGVVVSRIEERIDSLSMQLALQGQDLGILIQQANIAGCIGQISANSFSEESYMACVGQIVAYTNAAFNAVIVGCPPLAVNVQPYLLPSAALLDIGEPWQLGRLSCYINRAFEDSMGSNSADIRIPNFELLTKGIDLLRTMRSSRPLFWANVGVSIRADLKALRQKIETLSEVQAQRLGPDANHQNVFLARVFEANFARFAGFASELDSASEQAKASASRLFIDQSIALFGDSALTDRTGPGDGAPLMPFTNRHNGYTVYQCPQLQNAPSWINKHSHVTRSGIRSDGKSRIALLRALEDSGWASFLGQNPPNYPMVLTQVCSVVQDVSWRKEGNGMQLSFKVLFRLTTASGTVEYTSALTELPWIPRTEGNEENFFLQYNMQHFLNAYPVLFEGAMNSFRLPLEQELTRVFTTKLNIDASFSKYFETFQEAAWQMSLQPRKEALAEQWDGLSLSRALLRAYFVSFLPEIWQRSDPIVLLLSRTGQSALFRHGRFTGEILPGKPTDLCNVTVDPIRRTAGGSSFINALEACKSNWNTSVSQMPKMMDKQWQHHGDLFDAVLALKVLERAD